jgi:hypothetical protein
MGKISDELPKTWATFLIRDVNRNGFYQAMTLIFLKKICLRDFFWM